MDVEKPGGYSPTRVQTRPLPHHPFIKGGAAMKRTVPLAVRFSSPKHEIHGRREERGGSMRIASIVFALLCAVTLPLPGFSQEEKL
ncbi:MAG TPA: hypothetical protein VNS56_04910, partial [Methylomirabilota bacterium]|nr:hypothetical protein [Methylomirabilota bacterium]